jgi:hypothetical protein
MKNLFKKKLLFILLVVINISCNSRIDYQAEKITEIKSDNSDKNDYIIEDSYDKYEKVYSSDSSTEVSFGDLRMGVIIDSFILLFEKITEYPLTFNNENNLLQGKLIPDNLKYIFLGKHSRKDADFWAIFQFDLGNSRKGLIINQRSNDFPPEELLFFIYDENVKSISNEKLEIMSEAACGVGGYSKTSVLNNLNYNYLLTIKTISFSSSENSDEGEVTSELTVCTKLFGLSYEGWQLLKTDERSNELK